MLSIGELHDHIAAVRLRQAEIRAVRKGVPSNVSPGPLGAQLITDARWNNEDEYPAYQAFADELERLLIFAEKQNQYELYFSKLAASARQRDAALDELRVASHLNSNAFSILQWNPIGLPPKEGEYLISSSSRTEVFVEVKSPTWQSELTEDEIKAGRTQEPKYLYCEGGAYAHWPLTQDAIDRAYKKFSPAKANLLVIPGDGPRVSMRHGLEAHAYEALYIAREPYNGYFTSQIYEKLGGVAFFFMDGGFSPVSYSMALFLNPYALVQLPKELQEAFPCIL